MPQRYTKERTIVMTIRWMRAAVATSCLLLGSCASDRAELPVQQYVPTTQAMLPLGELRLSNTLLQFVALEGEMKLQYVGIMPDSAGPDIAGATIYRVRNADAFFKKNAGKGAFCEEVPRWVAVSSRTGAPAWSQEIWVGLLTLPEWQKFTHATDRVCTGGSYVRTAG
jgi:hypothetical protein